MFHIGFQSLRRTVYTCAIVTIAGYAIVLLFSLFGDGLLFFVNAFLLFLSTAIADVMVCWALAGTHVQAFIRIGWIAVSIFTGIIVTALLFSLAVGPYAGIHFGSGFRPPFRYRLWCSNFFLCHP